MDDIKAPSKTRAEKALDKLLDAAAQGSEITSSAKLLRLEHAYGEHVLVGTPHGKKHEIRDEVPQALFSKLFDPKLDLKTEAEREAELATITADIRAALAGRADLTVEAVKFNPDVEVQNENALTHDECRKMIAGLRHQMRVLKRRLGRKRGTKTATIAVQPKPISPKAPPPPSAPAITPEQEQRIIDLRLGGASIESLASTMRAEFPGRVWSVSYCHTRLNYLNKLRQIQGLPLIVPPPTTTKSALTWFPQHIEKLVELAAEHPKHPKRWEIIKEKMNEAFPDFPRSVESVRVRFNSLMRDRVLANLNRAA